MSMTFKKFPANKHIVILKMFTTFLTEQVNRFIFNFKRCQKLFSEEEKNYSSNTVIIAVVINLYSLFSQAFTGEQVTVCPPQYICALR